MLTKKDLEGIAELARIEIKKSEEEKLLCDLRGILGHFEELNEVNTSDVEPMDGGTSLHDVFRSDDSEENMLSREDAVQLFPEKERGFLKTPPVFE